MPPPPVGPQKAVHTVVGNRGGVDIDATERAAELFDGRKVWAIDLDDLGEVVIDQPEPEVAGSQVRITMRPRATRVSSPRPRAGSGQWCTVRMARAASNAASRKGSWVADA